MRIREVLASATSAIPLSNELFRRGGLFGQLAKTRDERQELVQSPLFQEAQRRLSDLQQKEMEEFRQGLRERERQSQVMSCSFDMQQLQNV
jgi:ABC-type phosphate transport system auxiliary subunit